MGDSLSRIGINHLNHKLKVKKGGIEVTSGNVSGSIASTGSFGKLIGEGGAISNITVKPWSATGSFYGATSDIQITGSLSVSGNITGSFSGLAVGQKYLHAQTVAATTWTVSHNFNYQYVNVDVYDGNDQIVIPTSITATDSDTITLTFSSAVSGNAIVSTGGQNREEKGKNKIHNQAAAATNWKVTHSVGEQYPAVTVYDESDNVIIPQQIYAADAQKMEIIFEQPVAGNANISVGGGVSLSAITSSVQLSADSFGDISGSVSSTGSFGRLEVAGVSSVGALIATTLDTGQGANELYDMDQNVKTDTALTLATITTGQGTNELYDMDQNVKTDSSPTFADITATGAIVAKEIYTEFVSSSVVYSSGSNIFGDDGTDKHIFTGSLQLSGSLANESYIIGTNVGIGKTDPTSILDVTGTIQASAKVSGSVTSTGSFGAINVAGMSVSNLVDVSSSFSTRVLNLKSDSGSFSTRVSNLKSDSGSFCTRVSKIKRDRGSFSTRVTDLKSDSGSFSSRVTTNEGKATKGFTIAMSVAL